MKWCSKTVFTHIMVLLARYSLSFHSQRSASRSSTFLHSTKPFWKQTWHRINKNCPNSWLWRLQISWGKEAMQTEGISLYPLFSVSHLCRNCRDKCSANCVPQLSDMCVSVCVCAHYFSLLFDPISIKHLARKTIKKPQFCWKLIIT